MRTPGRRGTETDRLVPGARRRHRGPVLLGAGVLALALATTGMVAVRAGRPSPVTRADERSMSTVDPTTAPSVVVVLPTETAAHSVAPRPSPTVEASPDPTALLDGRYPTFVREVDVDGATITVDVLQTFLGKAAIRAAVADGMTRRDARYLPVYIRNENDLLRTLPVARDVHIKFMGTCESPGNRHLALTQLEEATTPFTTNYYYAVKITGGSVERISQHITVAGC